jgi:hypothetical protein
VLTNDRRELLHPEFTRVKLKAVLNAHDWKSGLHSLIWFLGFSVFRGMRIRLRQ